MPAQKVYKYRHDQMASHFITGTYEGSMNLKMIQPQTEKADRNDQITIICEPNM